MPAHAAGIRDRQWYLSALKVAQAQRITKGQGVVVAVLDSGVTAHRDLRGAVLDGTGTVSTVAGRKGRFDDSGHGTAMASIIAARGGGGDGLLGIAPAAKILPVSPAGDTLATPRGVRWAVAHGATVLNMSFHMLDGRDMHQALREAAAADVVLVAAAGNTGRQDNAATYPAVYDEVLTVGAVDRRGRVAAFSHHGADVDLVAPGVDIAAAYFGDEYQVGEGTSQATAIVSGAAALIRAKHPDLSAAQVVELLTSTARDGGAPGRDDYYGHGELDLLAALTAPPPAASPSPSPAGRADAPVAGPVTPVPERGPAVPPLLIAGAGVLVLLAAGVILLLLVRRSRRS